jgi:sirohydrochlorin cobaltochelatase
MTEAMSGKAVLVCGHGSRDPDAIGEFEEFAHALRRRLPSVDFATGYLEFARPTIRDGLAQLAARGARRIFAIPGMLFAASHVKNDLPWEINSFAAENPGIELRFGRDLAIDPRLLRASAERIGSAAQNSCGESVLIVVGRGTNDPDANSNVAKITRMLWEGMGFGWAETAFSGVAEPRVETALACAVRLGFRRIVVFPYFLFTGVLVKRIYAQTDAAARHFGEIEFVKAPYLRDHPAVLDAFCERVVEPSEGPPAMNCQLCKYRTQIIGYEGDTGAAQEGHHHHVRGIGAGHAHPHPHPPPVMPVPGRPPAWAGVPGVGPGIHAPDVAPLRATEVVDLRDQPGDDGSDRSGPPPPSLP